MPRARGSKSKKSSGTATTTTASLQQRQWEFIPRLVVFDLDFTLWFPEMYELDGVPFKKNAKTGAVTDRSGEQVHFFPAVHTVLSVLETHPQFKDVCEVAVASRTTEPQWAKTCMRLMDVAVAETTNSDGDARDETMPTSLQSIVDYEAIYPRNKCVHFAQLKEQSGVEYEDMLFFDNEYYNITDVGKMGVVCAYCPQGLSEGSWIQGMEAFQEAKRKAAAGEKRTSTQTADTGDY